MSDRVDSLRYLELRDQARRLRRLADELDDEAARYQGEANATIGGYALVEAAVAILEDHGQPHGLHLRELLATIERRTGRRITGTDPYATLLANIGRDPRIESVRSRSGIYRRARAHRNQQNNAAQKAKRRSAADVEDWINRAIPPADPRALTYGEPGRAAIGKAVRRLAVAQGRGSTREALLDLAAIATAWADRLGEA